MFTIYLVLQPKTNVSNLEHSGYMSLSSKQAVDKLNNFCHNIFNLYMTAITFNLYMTAITFNLYMTAITFNLYMTAIPFNLCI